VSLTSKRPEKKSILTYLGDTSRVRLNERAETSERRILLFVVSDFVQGLAPRLCEFWEMRSDEVGVHQSYPTYRYSSVLMQASWRFGMKKNGYES
jgi:hypothetical protein